MAHFRSIVAGMEDLPANFHLPRHRHLHAYATIVLAGSFEEAGYAGRIKASAGHLLIHPVLDCHVDRMITRGVRLLRLPWPDDDDIGGLFCMKEIDFVARIAEKDMREAQSLVTEILQKQAERALCLSDWPDLLAEAIKRDQRICISEWAEAHGLARETVSRGFSAVWGISPVAFRAEWRARKACLELLRNRETLAAIAARTEFSDQAHMTRWIGRITGVPPLVWRNGNSNRLDPPEYAQSIPFCL